jgi:lipid-binding SYLF domain-containing protein
MRIIVKLFMVLSLLFSAGAFASEKEILEAEANLAIKKFNDRVEGGEDFLSKVKGYLVFPSVMRGGLVFGGEFGRGVLIVNNQTEGYFNMVSGSVGLQIGVQKRAILIAFVSQRALDSFLATNGFTVGVDGSLNFANWGTSRDLSTAMLGRDVIVFAFDETGVMGGVSVDGSKITRINLD